MGINFTVIQSTPTNRIFTCCSAKPNIRTRESQCSLALQSRKKISYSRSGKIEFEQQSLLFHFAWNTLQGHRPGKIQNQFSESSSACKIAHRQKNNYAIFGY